MQNKMQYELGFLGAGNMAEAIAKAAMQQDVLRADQMIASDPSENRRGVFSQLKIQTCSNNAELIGSVKQVLIAVKPQAMAQAAADLGQYGFANQVILSIMAGITTSKLSQAIAALGVNNKPRIIRVMPNTPLQVGFGMAGVAKGDHAQEGDESLALRLFGAAGKVVLIDESKIDALTAISGSGPAYVFYLAEAMQQAAKDLGLAEHAGLLAQQTILGAAHLMIESSDDPAMLRRKVTSPGGTTEAAINYLEQHKTAEVIAGAIQAAAKRSVELGQ